MIDIHSQGAYPSDALSNFAAHEFMVDGIPCASMEGFLQSLKFMRKPKQKRICRLVGKEAKKCSRQTAESAMETATDIVLGWCQIQA